MEATKRIEAIRLHLSAISRGGAPNSDLVAVWLRELEKVPLEVLDQRLRQARQEHAEKLEAGRGWGHITPDDVLRVHRRHQNKATAGADGPPENLSCGHRCSAGRVSMRSPDGMDYCVRCSCPSGDYWKQNRALGSQPDVEGFLGRPGWSYAQPPVMLPDTHRQWIANRAEQVGPIQAAQDYWAEIRARRG